MKFRLQEEKSPLRRAGIKVVLLIKDSAHRKRCVGSFRFRLRGAVGSEQYCSGLCPETRLRDFLRKKSLKNLQKLSSFEGI